jgi:hypothetical protein
MLIAGDRVCIDFRQSDRNRIELIGLVVKAANSRLKVCFSKTASVSTVKRNKKYKLVGAFPFLR